MQQLIHVIGAAIATDATKEQKAAGAQACRTILTALDAEPGQPLVLPGLPQSHALTGVSIDQVLELAIARLSAVAKDREHVETSSAATAASVVGAAAPTRPAALSPALRVPLASSNALKVASRSANVRQANTKRGVPPNRK